MVALPDAFTFCTSYMVFINIPIIIMLHATSLLLINGLINGWWLIILIIIHLLIMLYNLQQYNVAPTWHSLTYISSPSADQPKLMLKRFEHGRLSSELQFSATSTASTVRGEENNSDHKKLLRQLFRWSKIWTWPRWGHVSLTAEEDYTQFVVNQSRTWFLVNLLRKCNTFLGNAPHFPMKMG